MPGNNVIDIVVLAVIIVIVIIIFIRIAVKLRKYGGSLTSTMFGATYEFLNKDRAKAIEQIVETKASKKMEEQSSKKPREE
jgi:predicted Holliday junction resolvase-like endonuclease